MTENHREIQTIEQATNIDQLLTSRGMAEFHNPFAFGHPVVEREGFVGREETIQEIEALAADNGVAILEGGQRSGKTSLLQVASSRLVREGYASKKLLIDLAYMENYSPEKCEREIRETVARASPRGKNLVIAFDEANDLLLNSGQAKVLANTVEKLTKEDHIILLSVNGDIETNSQHPDIIEARQKLLSLAGNEVVVNQLMSDTEIQNILSPENQPIFTDLAVQYLVKESGGHPLLASLLASEMFETLQDVQDGAVDFNDWQKEFQQEVLDLIPGHFDFVVATIQKAGFDPQTWKFRGRKPQPNKEVYLNMLPRFTATLFHQWLDEHLRRQKRSR